MTMTQQRPLSESGADPVADAANLLMRLSSTEVWPMDRSVQDKMLKKARFRVHPDRNGGDRTGWDAVEEAAKLLGIHR